MSHVDAGAFGAPPTLQDGCVRLEPMQPGHVEGLAEACADGRLWELWYTSVPHPDAMRDHVELLLQRQALGTQMPFVVVRREDGCIVGQTSFCNMDPDNRRVEIGHTWYARSVQRSGINSRAKLLMLAHAFEAWRCIAVEFRTHWFNQPSRAAIARLGAKQDGVLRNHQRLADGSLRDTVVFSITDAEWPAVKRNLVERMARHAAVGEH